MKKLALWLTLSSLLSAAPAFALDASSGVQVTPLLKTTQSWNGAPLAYPAGPAEVTALIVEIAPGKQTGWHLHPVASFAYMLSGTLEVTLQDGRVKRLQAGDPLAEVINTPHNGRNVGDTPVKLVVFYTGTVGQALTLPVPDPR